VTFLLAAKIGWQLARDMVFDASALTLNAVLVVTLIIAGAIFGASVTALFRRRRGLERRRDVVGTLLAAGVLAGGIIVGLESTGGVAPADVWQFLFAAVTWLVFPLVGILLVPRTTARAPQTAYGSAVAEQS
jgi:hypothetical protein